MAVPNNNTFLFTDVKSNVTGSPDDLAQAFVNANQYAFDGNYSGAKDSLLNFRNYDENRNYLQGNYDPLLFAKAGGNNSFNIISNTNWIVTSDQGWCTVTPNMGVNNSTISINVGANGSPVGREATITVQTTAGVPFLQRTKTITQLG